MQVEFIDFPRTTDFEAVVLCYLMEAGFHAGLMTSSIPYVAHHGLDKGPLCVLVTEDTVDLEEYPEFKKYTPIMLDSVIVWSFDCIQITVSVDKLTESLLNPALRDFMTHRYGLKPFGEGSTEQLTEQSKNEMEKVISAIVDRMIESARNTVITSADELRIIDVALVTHRNQIRSLIDEHKSIEVRVEKHRKLFASDKEFQEASLQQAASNKLNELRAIFESGAIKNFEMTPREFRAITGTTYIEYPDDSGLKWDMGSFIIHIPLSGTTVAISQEANMKSPLKKTNCRCSHPHISGSHVCWGQWATQKINDLMQHAEFGQVVTLALQWLANYNPDSPYASMPSNLFSIAGKEYYHPLCGSWWDPRLVELLKQHKLDIETWKATPKDISSLEAQIKKEKVAE